MPFYIRTGKRLPATQTELRVIFREPPPVHIGLRAGDDRRPARDEFVVKLDPSTGARLVVDAHRADGKGPQPVTLDVEFADEGGEGPTPYEVLLHAALVGDSSRFKRQDAVEECWRIMQPLIDNPPPVHPYAPAPGVRRSRRRWSPTTAGGRGRGSWSPRRQGREPLDVAVPTDRRLRLPVELPHRARWSPRTARSTGCACPRSTRRARSGTSSTAAPARSGSARTASTCPTQRSYVPGTNVLTTTWHTPGGWLLVHDALTMGPRQGPDLVTPHTRPPADDDAEHVLVRLVECLEGSVEVELVCEPAFDYGREPATWTLVDEDGHAADATGAGQTFRLEHRPARSASRAARRGPGTRCRRASGRSARCRGPRAWRRPTDVDDAAARIDATVQFWRSWLARARIPDHPLRHPLERSALTIKGLTYMPTGATVAALTTSLPETPGGERNWDYRYTWMRDTTFTLQALHFLNLDWEADEFMQFVADLEPNPDGGLQIMYGIDGRRDLTESTRDELSGYEGARPVRIGNGAFDQRQNDVYGAVLDSLLLHTRRSKRLPAPAVAAGAVAGRRCAGVVAGARPGDLGGPRGSRSTTCRRS